MAAGAGGDIGAVRPGGARRGKVKAAGKDQRSGKPDVR